MGYIVSFLSGALGFAIWDKKQAGQPQFNAVAAIVEGIIIFYVWKKFFK